MVEVLENALQKVKGMKEIDILKEWCNIPNSQRKAISQKAEELCYDKEFCDYIGLNYCNINNMDVWRLELTLFYSQQTRVMSHERRSYFKE
jgi:hypothetical protein